MTDTNASSAITAAGLVVGTTTYEYVDTVTSGFVISQNPAGGTAVAIGSPVDLEVSLGPPIDTMILGGNRLVELQNYDGGWDSPLDDGDPYDGSDPETFASVAIGLAQAYRHNRHADDPNILVALHNARMFLLDKTDEFTVTDGALAVELDSILGGTICVNYVRTYFYDELDAGTYYDDASETVHDTTSYIQELGDRRVVEGEDNLAAWDLGLGLYSAHVIGANTTEWVEAVKDEIDELDGDDTHDVLGLAGAVFGLAAVGEDYNPYTGQHAAASSLSDLAAILAGYQLGSGGFTWYGWYTQEGLDEAVQETVYALMALSEFDRAGYLTAIRDAGVYLQSVQLATDGWKNYVVGGEEENEITGDALRGIAVVISQPAAVPDVTDMTQGDANLAIAAAGLTVGTLSYEYSDTVALDLILGQNPSSGRMVPVISSVDLVVSSGQPIVPDVVWMLEADANLAITAVDSLKVGTVTYEYHDSVDEGLVISQNPVGETPVPIGSSVDLIISLGRPSVPNVVGMTETEANSAVTGFGLVIGSISREYSGTVAEGHVISQNPTGGTVVDVGTAVNITVSLGLPTVPHVIGESEPNAVAAIEAIDALIAATTYQYDNSIPFGFVISQDPNGGTVVSAGTTVNIVVSLGQPTVPGVVGESEAAARVAIEAKILSAEQRYRSAPLLTLSCRWGRLRLYRP
jgi:beta-lactam-binding protein with PASTA domain